MARAGRLKGKRLKERYYTVSASEIFMASQMSFSHLCDKYLKFPKDFKSGMNHINFSAIVSVEDSNAPHDNELAWTCMISGKDAKSRARRSNFFKRILSR